MKTKRETIENIDGEINYVKEKLSKMDREKSEGRKEWHEGYVAAMKEARNKVNQLDEPEILTPEWIDERIHYSTDQDAFGNIVKIESVPVKYLQNLLVRIY